MAILIDLTAKATLLVVGAAAVTFLMRRASAALRHLVWTSAFAAILLLPFARVMLPTLRVAVLPPTPSLAARLPIEASNRQAGTVTEPNETRAISPPPSLAIVPADQPSVSALRVSQILTVVWTLVTGLLILRVIVGVAAASRLARHAQPVTDRPLLTHLDQIRRNLHVRRAVRLLMSSDQQMPVTWGVVRPVILLPSSVAAWRADDPAQLDSVLTHEVAHIARWDAVSQLIIRLGVAMFWFNPLMWITARHVRLERERACDDAVLALGTRPSDYAGHLLAIGRFQPTPGSAPGLAMARRSQLERRVRAVLDEHVNRCAMSRSMLAVASLLVVAVVPVSAVSLSARQAETVPIAGAVEPATLAEPRPSPLPVTLTRKIVTSNPARSVPHASGPLNALVPTEIQSSSLPQIPAGGFSAATWREDRALMLQQLRERARQHFRDVTRKVEIGTMTSIQALTAETIVVNLEAAIATDNRAGGSYVPSDAEFARLTREFDVALRNLDVEETRMAAGMTTSRILGVALMNAVNVLLSARPTTDAALIAALRDAAMIASGTDRAAALLALAERNALSPEMVTIYVAAASGITSEADRARVFAQPIRIRP